MSFEKSVPEFRLSGNLVTQNTRIRATASTIRYPLGGTEARLTLLNLIDWLRLVIIVPQVMLARQRELFVIARWNCRKAPGPVNEVIEIELARNEVVITRYGLPV